MTRRLSLLLYAALLALAAAIPGPRPAHAFGGGSTDVAPTAWSRCDNGVCQINVREFDVNNRNHVYLAHWQSDTGQWTSSTETTAFTLAGNIAEGYFHWAIDNTNHLQCFQPTGGSGWSQESDHAGQFNLDAKHATPGGIQNPSMSHYVVTNIVSGLGYDYPALGNQGSTPCYQGGPGLVTINSGGTNWSSAVTNMSDGAHVVVTGLDGAVWNWANGWQSEGGGSLGSPAAVSWDTGGRLDLFIRGQDNALWQRGYQNGVWGSWISHGGILSSGPGCTSWQAGRLFCAAVGQDGASLWGIGYDGIGWSAWYPIGS